MTCRSCQHMGMLSRSQVSRSSTRFLDGNNIKPGIVSKARIDLRAFSSDVSHTCSLLSFILNGIL